MKRFKICLAGLLILFSATGFAQVKEPPPPPPAPVQTAVEKPIEPGKVTEVPVAIPPLPAKPPKPPAAPKPIKEDAVKPIKEDK